MNSQPTPIRPELATDTPLLIRGEERFCFPKQLRLQTAGCLLLAMAGFGLILAHSSLLKFDQVMLFLFGIEAVLFALPSLPTVLAWLRSALVADHSISVTDRAISYHQPGQPSVVMLWTEAEKLVVHGPLLLRLELQDCAGRKTIPIHYKLEQVDRLLQIVLERMNSPASPLLFSVHIPLIGPGLIGSAVCWSTLALVPIIAWIYWPENPPTLQFGLAGIMALVATGAMSITIRESVRTVLVDGRQLQLETRSGKWLRRSLADFRQIRFGFFSWYNRADPCLMLGCSNGSRLRLPNSREHLPGMYWALQSAWKNSRQEPVPASVSSANRSTAAEEVFTPRRVSAVPFIGLIMLLDLISLIGWGMSRQPGDPLPGEWVLVSAVGVVVVVNVVSIYLARRFCSSRTPALRVVTNAEGIQRIDGDAPALVLGWNEIGRAVSRGAFRFELELNDGTGKKQITICNKMAHFSRLWGIIRPHLEKRLREIPLPATFTRCRSFVGISVALVGLPLVLFWGMGAPVAGTILALVCGFSLLQNGWRRIHVSDRSVQIEYFLHQRQLDYGQVQDVQVNFGSGHGLVTITLVDESKVVLTAPQEGLIELYLALKSGWKRAAQQTEPG